MTYTSKIIASALVSTAAALGVAGAATASTVSLSLTGTFEDIVGTTATVSGSGSTDNTVAWSNGDSARFQMTDAGTGDLFGLEVTPIGWTGAFGPGPARDNLMIARTVNSQGLTDSGTLSIYMRPDGSSQAYTATMRLSLSDIGFTTPAPLDLTVTSLDIDFGQQMRVGRASLDSYGLSDPTDIVVGEAGSDITFTGPGSASFADADAAVSLRYVDTSTFDLTFAHNNVALYMLEFRSPSAVVDDREFVTVNVSPVPLPASALLLVAALGGLGAARARRTTG